MGTKRLFIGGLHLGITDAEIIERFSKFGNVKNVDIKVKTGSEGSPSKVFAYVDIETSDIDLKKCFSTYNGSKWKGFQLKIQVAKENFLDRLDKERQSEELNSDIVESKPVKKSTTKPILDDKITRVEGVEEFQMKGAPPGTQIPGEKDWVVGKYGRVLPVVNIMKNGTGRLMKVDPSKLTHNLKRINAEMDTDCISPSSLTWTMDDNDSVITKKRKGEFPEWKLPAAKKPLLSNNDVDSNSKESLLNVLDKLKAPVVKTEMDFEIVPILSAKNTKFKESKTEEVNNLDLSRFDSDNDEERGDEAKVVCQKTNINTQIWKTDKKEQANERGQTFIFRPAEQKNSCNKEQKKIDSKSDTHIQSTSEVVEGKRRLKRFQGTKFLSSKCNEKEIPVEKKFDCKDLVPVVKTIVTNSHESDKYVDNSSGDINDVDNDSDAENSDNDVEEGTDKDQVPVVKAIVSNSHSLMSDINDVDNDSDAEDSDTDEEEDSHKNQVPVVKTIVSHDNCVDSSLGDINDVDNGSDVEEDSDKDNVKSDSTDGSDVSSDTDELLSKNRKLSFKNAQKSGINLRNKTTNKVIDKLACGLNVKDIKTSIKNIDSAYTLTVSKQQVPSGVVSKLSSGLNVKDKASSKNIGSAYTATVALQQVSSGSISNQSSVSTIKKEASSDPDKKRLEAVKKRQIEHQQQKSVIKEALSHIDKINVNKKIVFDSDSEEVEAVSADKSQSSDNVKTDSQLEQKKSTLFDTETSSDEEELDKARFNIRKEFEGSKGSKLITLQSKYGNDPRFKLDARFIESDSDSEDEDVHKSAEDPVEEERQRSLKILQAVVGTKGLGIRDPQDKMKKKFKDISVLKYDPTNEEHRQFEVKRAPKESKKSAKNKDHSKSKETPQVEPVPVEELPEVSKEKYFKISDSLKDAFTTSTPDNAKGFSILAAFGANSIMDDQDLDNQDSQAIPIPATLRFNQLSLDNRFNIEQDESSNDKDSGPSDSDESDRDKTKDLTDSLNDDQESVHSADSADSSNDDQEVVPLANSTDSCNIDKKEVHSTNFFFTDNDSRLKDGEKFYCVKGLDIVREAWNKKRHLLIESYRSKHKNFKRKHKSVKKPLQKWQKKK